MIFGGVCSLSEMQHESSRKHNVMLKTYARADVVIGFCGIEISHFSPETNREQRLDRRSDVDTSAELYGASARSSRLCYAFPRCGSRSRRKEHSLRPLKTMAIHGQTGPT